MEQPKWVDDYINVTHKAWVGMTPSHWGSLNFFEALPYLNGAFIERVHEAVLRLRAKNVSNQQLADTFSTVSSLRAVMFWLAQEYIQCDPKPKAAFRETMEFLAAILDWWTPEDFFGMSTNRAHRSPDVKKMLQEVPWATGTPEIARELGRLYNSAAAVAFALYRDMFPQEAHETYGPYDVSERFGAGAIMTIKDFPKIKPVELWPNAAEFKYSRIRIFQVYKGVDYSIEWIGMHSRYVGDLINDLVAYAVEVDGRFITDISEIKDVRLELELTALKQSTMYDGMTISDWIKECLEWDCYQCNKFFALADMDWRPTEKMLANVKNATASMGFGIDSIPPLEEYKKDQTYEPYWLIDLYK